MRRTVVRKRILLACLFATAAWCQPWQLGANFGYGWYNNGSILSPEGSITAGIRNRFAAGVYIGRDFNEYISGEFRYLYHDGHPFLQGLGVKTDIQGQSQALTVEPLFHFKDRRHKLRPYVAGGIGAKGYVIAGPAPFPQPIPSVATLNEQDQWKVVWDVGGGVKYSLGRHVSVRGEFRDYLTTFPRQQIAPAPHNTARGIFEQFTPLLGVSYIF